MSEVVHNAEIESSFTRGTWDATCSCGWEACEFDDYDAALAAIDEHRREEGA